MSDERLIHPNSPVHFEHWCGQEGCKRWGSFGKDRRGVIEWRCSEHVAADYWAAATPGRN